ncbi:MAG: hypothetical protein ACYTE6_03970 [Planctomycetota bacterium]|jgi:hypothetical protein
MSVVLNWIKSNVYTVVFLAIMVVAPVALWVVSGRMNAAVRADVQARAGKISELDRLEKTNVELSIPGPDNPKVSATIPVNRRFLDRYQEVVDKISQDAEQIRARVVQMNCKGRGVLLDELFPDPPSHLRETLPGQMYRALLSAHEQLLKDCEAGAPPSVEDMVIDLEAARDRYQTQILMRSAGDLSEDEQIALTEQLTKERLSIYAETANDIKLYATLAELSVPDESERPERAEGYANTQMFDWQWQYWIKEDILKGLHAANEPYGSVVDAPVKRLVSLTVLDGPVPQESAGAATDSSRGGGSPGGFGPAGGGGRRSGGRQAAASGARPAVAADPSREVPLDYSVSFTGRTDNPLYDVRLVELVIVVESARIPEVFDALARRNFITVIAPVQVDALDLFGAIKDGYFYGAAPVSQLTLTLETIWLREWTAQYMPAELKQALGIPIEAPTTG